MSRSLSWLLAIVLVAVIGVGCSDEQAANPHESWPIVSAGPVSLRLPPGFAAVSGDGLDDLGESLGSTFEGAAFVARRGSLTDPAVDLIVVTTADGSLADAVPDLCKPLRKPTYTVLSARDTDLPIGTARRCAVTAQVPVPDLAHPRTTKATRWHVDVDGDTVTLLVVRLADGSSVPEADRIAESMTNG